MSTAELVLALALAGLALVVGYLLGRRAPARDAVATTTASKGGESVPRPPAREPIPSRPESAPPPQDVTIRQSQASPLASLQVAQSWGYQLQDLDIRRAAASPFDLLVIDYAKDGTDDTALSPTEIERLKQKPDGSRRLVLAYISIGEAESYRFYWRKEWKRQRPEWLLGENPDWDENYAVCFWEPGWQSLLCGSPRAYLDRILAQGFDGIYLDKCDVTEDLRRRERKAAAQRPDLEADMVRLVTDLASYARARRPDFLVVMQNAEPLLERPELRQVIDGVAKEELLYGLDGAEKANDREEVAWSRERLDLMRRDGKPVFVVEYLNDRTKIAKAAEGMRKLGYVLYVSDKSRELDKLSYEVAEA